MIKKLMMIMVISLLACGAVFADEKDEKGEKKDLPRHTITIDALSTQTSLLVSLLAWDTLQVDGFFTIWSALQYEYQVSRRFSLAGRFGIRLINLEDYKAGAYLFETHVRLYPAGRVFFLDGELGYSLFTESERPNSHFVTFGGKLGWRIDPGKPGGFVIEPSLGYIYPIGRIKNSNDFAGDFFMKHLFVAGFPVSIGVGARF